MGEELAASSHRAAAGPAPSRRPGGAHPARLHQHVERALGDLDAADRLDLGAADRLVIGDDRQRLGRRARQPARLLAGPAQQMGKVGRGLEMPAPAALDQLDAAALRNARPSSAERGGDVALADMLGDFLDGQRRRPRRTGSLRPPGRTRPSGRRRRSLSGANGSSWASSSRPLPRQLQRGDEARGQRRAAELRVVGRRQEGFERGPFDRHADQPRRPARSLPPASSPSARGRRASPAGCAP